MTWRQRPIRIGVQLAPQHTNWTQLRSAAARVESCGADVLFNWDHFHPLSGPKDGAHFECWTMLGGWAEQTERIEIGAMVSAIGYRNPDLLADMARTVDHVSGGRLILGLGAGFKESEYRDYGYHFGSASERLDDLESGLQRIRSRLERLNPAPKRPIPIMIGGGGERRTLRLVAGSADIWNTFAEGEDYIRKSHRLDEFCAELGRDPGAIERSVLVGGEPEIVGTPLVQAGANLFILSLQPPYDLADVERWITWRDKAH